MRLTAFSLRQTRVIVMALLGIMLLGFAAYMSMARNSMPPFTIRVASVVTQFRGASPERVEALVTKRIERVAQELPEVDTITSDSQTGLSVVSVEVRQDVPESKLRAVWDRLRRKVEAIEGQLPAGAVPEVKDDNIGVVYGVIVGLQNDGFSPEELKTYADDLRDKILTLKDTAQVDISGLEDPEIYINFDPSKLAEYGLSSGMLQQTLSATNIIFPGGKVTLGRERLILEPSGNLRDVEAVRQLLVPLPAGGTVPLGQITEVERRYKTPPRSLVRINGVPGVTLAIAVREGSNLLRMGEQVDALMAAEQINLPVGIEVFRVAAQDTEVQTKVDDFISNLLQSMVAVLAVMLVMLGLRTGIVVASLIPMTMVFTFFAMKAMGQGINQVTLAGLIMALGMLVDNAIVVSEAVLVEMKRGASAREAAISASSELGGPLLISSLTTSAAFFAFYLAQSTMGEIVGPLFIVITLALLGSWLFSLTMIPLLMTWLAPKQKSEDEPEELFIRIIRAAYEPTLRICLRFRWLVALAVIPLFMGVMYTAQYLPFIFFPDSDRPLVQVDVQLPLGTRFEATNATVAELERFMRAELKDEVVDFSSFVGEGPPSYDLGYQPGEASSAYAHVLVNTRSGADNQTVIDAINRFSLQTLPDADVRAALLAGGGGGAPIEIRVFGDDPAALYQISDSIKGALLDIKGPRNVSDNWGPRLKKFVVDLNEDNLRAAGLTNQEVAQSLQTVLTGFKTADLREDDTLIPITLRAQGATEYTVDDMRNISVQNAAGTINVPLSQVGEIQLDWQWPRVRRRDQARMLSVKSYLEDGYTATDVSIPLVKWLEEQKKTWPKGYRYELGGESEMSDEGMSSIIEQLPTAGLIILMLLVVQFNSLRRTSIVLMTVPLGVIGVILGLHVFRSFFGFFGFIGVISLAGIIINNAIVLLDRIRIEIEENNRDPYSAVVTASNHRLRPILLTTLTTTVGLVPLYLGGGLMWEPLAVALMGGLVFGTLITLVFVPVVYAILFRVPRGGTGGTASLPPDPAPEPEAEPEPERGPQPDPGSEAGADAQPSPDPEPAPA